VETKTILLILMAVIATGCTSNTTSSGSGVQIEEFTITDNTLTPNQEANVRLQLANLKQNPTEI